MDLSVPACADRVKSRIDSNLSSCPISAKKFPSEWKLLVKLKLYFNSLYSCCTAMVGCEIFCNFTPNRWAFLVTIRKNPGISLLLGSFFCKSATSCCNNTDRTLSSSNPVDSFLAMLISFSSVSILFLLSEILLFIGTRKNLK